MFRIFEVFFIYTLIFCLSLFPGLRNLGPSSAWAVESAAATTTKTQTCTDNRGTYRGFSDTSCYNYTPETKNNNQQNTQKDTDDMNDKSANKSSMLGMAAIAAGMAMIAAGMAMKPPNMGLIMAGIALVMAGMAALAAAGKMNNNANKADANAGRMSAISGVAPATGGKLGNGGSASGIKIDPSLTRTGKASVIFDDFEKQTGISRDALVDQLQNGKSPAEILAGSGKVKASESQLQGLFDKGADTPLMGADETLSKLGMTPEDLEAYGKNTAMSATGDETVISSGGGAARAPASANNLDSLFGAKPEVPGGSGILGSTEISSLSPDLQDALDRNGITGLSVFQMVRIQYKKKTPMMFGVPARNPTATSENPFANLRDQGEVDL